MGLLKTPEDEEIPEENDENNLNKDASPFKDLMATLEKPADLTGKNYLNFCCLEFFFSNLFSFFPQLILELIQFLYFNITQTLLPLLVRLITIARKQLSSK